jgi:AraC-like DNA-binding protein
MGIDAPFTLRAPEFGERNIHSALISARTSHQIISGGGRMLFFYLDPGTPRARSIRDSMFEQSPTLCLHHRGEYPMLRYLRATEPPDPTQLREHILGTPQPPPIDERIRAAMVAIRDQPTRNLSAAELAAAAGLSVSRFLHLFSAHAGTSFRRYRVWARMLRVAAALGTGTDLTTDATDAGFASPSHFSDTFHTMFGLTATAVISTGVRIVVEDS